LSLINPIFPINCPYREINLNAVKLAEPLAQGTLVPKLTLGPLSVRNGHKLKDWVFVDPG